MGNDELPSLCQLVLKLQQARLLGAYGLLFLSLGACMRVRILDQVRAHLYTDLTGSFLGLSGGGLMVVAILSIL
jgi:hypothetical protein